MAAAAFHLSHSIAPAKHGFQSKKHRSTILLSPMHSSFMGIRSGGTRIKAFFNPLEDPIVKEAMKEPVAFMGGVFAGLLRLDLNEEPLRDWIARTAEAAGTEVEDPTADPDVDENSPQEIQIE